MLISVVIPVYNAEKFLPKCLNSIKNQTYKDLEVILINDGSTDRSGEICDEFSQKNERITVIHKENGGVSSARNAGLKAVKGQYVGFVDPDDWIEEKMLETLYKLVAENNADIAACGYFREDSEGRITNKLLDSKVISYNQTEALNTILSEEHFKGFTCNKLFSTEILKDITFDEEIHFCEDLLFCCQAISNSNKLVYDTTPYYHYITHNSNASQSQFSLKKLTALDALKNIVDLLENKEGVKINKFKNYYAHMNISLLMNGMKENKIQKDTRKELKGNLKRFKISDLTSKFVKLSCAIARVNVNLYYLIWNKAK
ncbi:glycosyltransferase family 2 protein [Bacillus cereus]|uniref:glycosyltransferase family 2 protein n=1 Tax=Bacillus cereus TaxID=1396 RepID=UPI000BF776DE|nr:glycosyltransferase [Bacillus cereus]PFQ01438.1 glycosyl transferase [Bacillus cereus]